MSDENVITEKIAEPAETSAVVPPTVRCTTCGHEFTPGELRRLEHADNTTPLVDLEAAQERGYLS